MKRKYINITLLVFIVGILLIGCGGSKIKEYYVDLNVEDIGSRQIKTNIKTNFPDGTNLHIWVYRTYYESGDFSIRYAGDMFSKDINVKDGKIDLLIDVNDSGWYNEYYKKAEEYKGIIDYPGISHISPEVKISILFTPKGNQPAEILEILGYDGEFMKGSGVEKSGNFSVYRISKNLEIHFQK